MPPGKQEDDREDEGRKPGFTVSDRRSFAESGEPKVVPEPATAPPPAAAVDSASVPRSVATSESAVPPPSESVAAAPDALAGSRATGLPPVDFHTFILSLGSSALLHLGELDHPDGSESKPDLPLAKHTIDIIAMLQDKTKGNLTPPEERLMESLLYDLRLRFVERNRASR